MPAQQEVQVASHGASVPAAVGDRQLSIEGACRTFAVRYRATGHSKRRRGV